MAESKELVLLEDIATIAVSSHDLKQTLDNITGLIARRLEVQVCCIYLLEQPSEGGERLVLRSSHGLEDAAVGAVSMTPDEGLTGLVFQQAEPLNVNRADDHPRFKYFPGIGEEAFGSYLGVPLIHRQKAIGVLSVQTAAQRGFGPNEVRMLVAAAGQLSGVIVNARLMDAQAHADPSARPRRETPEFVRGEGVSSGVGRGRLLVMTDPMDLVAISDAPVGSVEEELSRLRRALAGAIADVARLRDQVTRTLGEEDGAIFHAHLMMLEDNALHEKVREQVEAGDGAIRAVVTVAHEYMDAFNALEDPYLRERAADVRDIAHRVVSHLRAELPGCATFGDAPELTFDEPTVVLAVDLTPSQAVQLVQPNLAGLALTRGGRNAHTTILCRAAGVPALVGVQADPHTVEPGGQAIVDGNTGILYLRPSETVAAEYERLAADAAKFTEELRTHATEPSRTLDGVDVTLLGNGALVSDLPRIRETGATGVGLYRTEFPFFIRPSFPSEEEQAEAYAKVVRQMEGGPVTFRTLDVGGDKPLPYLPIVEENPQLGWRSIRVSFDLDVPFRDQVRAMLRASVHGPVRILFPMISEVAQMRRARNMVEVQADLLRRDGVALGEVEVGAMIEVPAAALIADRLARVCDFFSIGTNDLAQYLLAVDRGNAKVAHLYDPLHPAVLDLIGRVSEAGKLHGCETAVCGELAGRALGAAALIGLGVHELSVNPGGLLKIRRLIQCIEEAPLRQLAPTLRAALSGDEVRELLRGELERQGVPGNLWERE